MKLKEKRKAFFNDDLHPIWRKHMETIISCKQVNYSFSTLHRTECKWQAKQHLIWHSWVWQYIKSHALITQDCILSFCTSPRLILRDDKPGNIQFGLSPTSWKDVHEHSASDLIWHDIAMAQNSLKSHKIPFPFQHTQKWAFPAVTLSKDKSDFRRLSPSQKTRLMPAWLSHHSKKLYLVLLHQFQDRKKRRVSDVWWRSGDAPRRRSAP